MSAIFRFKSQDISLNISILLSLSNMSAMVTIRAYEIEDKEDVLHLIRLNTPQYFDPTEESDLSEYLEKEREMYFVLLYDKVIVGCGGINFAENKSIGKISWDIFHPDFQGMSLGSQLLNYRLQILKSIKSIQSITVRTSQLAYLFYQKHGFQLKEVQKDYWAQGLDMYFMEYSSSSKNDFNP